MILPHSRYILRSITYSKPMCECINRVAQRIESSIGFSEPPMNGATVSGIRPTEMAL